MTELKSENLSVENLPVIVAEPNRVTQLVKTLDLTERSRIITFGDNAQRKVADFAERVLEQTKNKEIGKTGELLSDVLAKARGLDPSSLHNASFLRRMFSSMEARIRRFRERFQDVASQVDHILLDLETNREILRRDIALLDELHDETKESIIELDAYIQAGKQFAERFQTDELVKLKEEADVKANTNEGILDAQNYQDALQSLDRLEKRLFYLEQARQIGIQQLAQIRIVQSGDETS